MVSEDPRVRSYEHTFILQPRLMADGREVSIMTVSFGNVQITVGPANQVYFDNYWQYDSPGKALAELYIWEATGAEGEPNGWFRHPPSGRRRPDGDANKEYILP